MVNLINNIYTDIHTLLHNNIYIISIVANYNIKIIILSY